MPHPDGQEPIIPIGVNFKIPVRYWYPTIIAVITFTAGGVWWFHEQISPLESRIAKLEASSSIPTTNANAASFTQEFSDYPSLQPKQLTDLSLDGSLSKRNEQIINNLVFQLTNQRRDLVLIVTGYVGEGKRSGSRADGEASNKIAQKIKEILIARGLPSDRIFADGYGQDVPKNFKSRDALNVALMPCDLLNLVRLMSGNA